MQHSWTSHFPDILPHQLVWFTIIVFSRKVYSDIYIFFSYVPPVLRQILFKIKFLSKGLCFSCNQITSMFIQENYGFPQNREILSDIF